MGGNWKALRGDQSKNWAIGGKSGRGNNEIGIGRWVESDPAGQRQMCGGIIKGNKK